jgi:hypothetical protein
MLRARRSGDDRDEEQDEGEARSREGARHGGPRS